MNVTGSKIHATADRRRSDEPRAGRLRLERPKALRTAALVVGVWLLGTAVAWAGSLQETIQSVLPRVVKIYGAGGLSGLEHYSTGFLVSEEGHVVTVWSHVLDAEEVTVVLDDGRRFPAKVLGAEPTLDLAVLKLQADELHLPHFNLDEAVDVPPGTLVLAFSNMFGIATGNEPVSVMHAVVSARTRLQARRGVFETTYRGPVYVLDAVTNNTGAGGGVVTTWDGRLVGMIGKELRNAQSNTWVNYAIPASEMASVVRQIRTGRFEPEARRQPKENPWRYSTVDFGFVLIPDVVHRTPPYVDAVTSGSQADRAGLRPGDLVVFVNGELVQSCRELKERLGWVEPGERVRLTVRRGDRLLEVELQAEPK